MERIVAVTLGSAVLRGFAGGVIRSNQGGDPVGGFFWGALLGILGVIVVAATKPKPYVQPKAGTSTDSKSTPWPFPAL